LIIFDHKIKVGDIVSAVIGDEEQTFICSDKIGKKYRLVHVTEPRVTVMLDKTKVIRRGPWR
jgi:hypothetical protein